jgi:GNAT superfamily N-acetyltransferase
MSTPSGARSQPAKIEHLIAGDGQRLRAIRLRALRDAPDAFGTTLEEAAAQPVESWERQLQQAAAYVATVGGCDTGLARGARHDRLCDTGYLLSMWVAPEVRRQGVGADLFQAIVRWARTEGLNRLLLDVAEGNVPARALYDREGFKPNGVRGTLPPPRQHVREIQLELTL